MKKFKENVKNVSKNKEKRVFNWHEVDCKQENFMHTKYGKSLKDKSLKRQCVAHISEDCDNQELYNQLILSVKNYIAEHYKEDEIEKLAYKNINEEISWIGLIGIYPELANFDNSFENTYHRNIAASKIKITIPKNSLRVIYQDKWIIQKNAITGNIKHQLISTFHFNINEIKYNIFNYNKNSMYVKNYYDLYYKDMLIKQGEVILKIQKFL